MDIDFEKGGGLVPAIVQDARTGTVLMLGYMNREALDRTVETGLVTFFSRERGVLWTKGETSGNTLAFESMAVDCDGDTLLVRARPSGPVCHTGTDTCWGESNEPDPMAFLAELDAVVAERSGAPPEESYTRRLLDGGAAAAGQKVGEEAVETVVAALAQDDGRLVDEAADLVYHLVVLLRTRGLSLGDVARRLEERHRPNG
jgi:phosphoribosyl-ATP pyrophosphohydrolase/phosphoribosyl-AMP cyclohydrolase